MSIFQGAQLPAGSSTQQAQSSSTQSSSTAFAPFAERYLTDLSQGALGQMPVEGQQLIAPESALLQSAYSTAPTALARYTTPLAAGTAAAQNVAGGLSAEDISKFYNPYEQQVVDEMARQSAQNVQRNLLPQLRAGFVGSGGLGSQRYAGALGQTLGDIQSDLLGQQAKARAAGYSGALDAALREAGYQTQAAQALSSLGTAEQNAAVSGLKSMADLGAIEQAYDQSKIEAPITRLLNIGQVMRGYPMQTSSSSGSSGSTSSGSSQQFTYANSPLSQISGLGALLGSGFNSPSGWGNKLVGGLKDLFSGVSSMPEVSSWEGLTDSGYGTAEDYT